VSVCWAHGSAEEIKMPFGEKICESRKPYIIYLSTCADAPSSHWSSAILSSRVRYCISRRHFTSSSAIQQQSTIWTSANASEVWWTFVLECRTQSLEQSTVFAARTYRHQNFSRKLKTVPFQQAYNWIFKLNFVQFYPVRFILLLCNPLVKFYL